MRAVEGKLFSNIAATTAAFLLTGGKYGVMVVGADFGTVKLQRQGPDGTTYISTSSDSDFSANGMAVVDLPPGLYKFVVASATAVFAQVQRIPGE